MADTQELIQRLRAVKAIVKYGPHIHDGYVLRNPAADTIDEAADALASIAAQEPVAWRYRHALNPNLWVVVSGPDWPERDPDMEPLYTHPGVPKP